MTWPDIDAFTRQTNTSLTEWEVEVVERLDDLYVKFYSQKQTDKTGRGGSS